MHGSVAGKMECFLAEKRWHCNYSVVRLFPSFCSVSCSVLTKFEEWWNRKKVFGKKIFSITGNSAWNFSSSLRWQRGQFLFLEIKKPLLLAHVYQIVPKKKLVHALVGMVPLRMPLLGFRVIPLMKFYWNHKKLTHFLYSFDDYLHTTYLNSEQKKGVANHKKGVLFAISSERFGELRTEDLTL